MVLASTTDVAAALLTTPLRATVRLVASLVTMSILPVRGPLCAVAARRTAMLVEATVLLLRKSSTLVVKLVVPARAIS